MRQADRRVVFSRYAERLVTGALGTRPDFVPHGIDPTVFRPGNTSDAKRRVVGSTSNFIVGSIATNALRKNLPVLIAAFARFAADKPEALLYLHTPIAGYWDIEELTDHYGVTDRTRATLNYDPHFGVPDVTLATIYQAMDLLVLPTMGEGFGLPLLEAAACGVPALATDCSSCPELLPDPRQRIAVTTHVTLHRNIRQAIVCEKDLLARMNQAYHEPSTRQHWADQGLTLASNYHWSSVAERFLRIIKVALS